MNIARLEEMVVSGDLSAEGALYLVKAHMECEWLDYKESLVLEQDKALCDFARDVLALKNSGGGYLVVGVRDKTWDAVGLDPRFLTTANSCETKFARLLVWSSIWTSYIINSISKGAHERLHSSSYAAAESGRSDAFPHL